MTKKIEINDPNVLKEVISYPSFIFKEISLNDKEKIKSLSRKHWVVFRDPFLIAFFFPFLFVFIALFLSTPYINLPKLISDTVSTGFLYLAPLFFIIGAILFMLRLFTWYKTVYIITDQRLIKIEQETLFQSRIHQIYLDKVQDAICKISGLKAVLYGYGDISIQGSSETAQIEINTVANPKKLQQVISNLAGQAGRDL